MKKELSTIVANVGVNHSAMLIVGGWNIRSIVQIIVLTAVQEWTVMQMNEYISREDILDIVSQYCTDDDGSCSKAGVDLREMLDEIEALPATDVQPVKHGYWEEVTDYGGWGDTHYRCSVCGEEWYLEDGKPKDNNMNFCPRCGAKMDAEPDEPWQSE